MRTAGRNLVSQQSPIEFKRPLPNLKEHDTREFWQATKDGKLTYQKCVDCGRIVFYPRAHCTGCLGSNLAWHTASGRGTVHSWTITHYAFHPALKGDLPRAGCKEGFLARERERFESPCRVLSTPPGCLRV